MAVSGVDHRVVAGPAGNWAIQPIGQLQLPLKRKSPESPDKEKEALSLKWGVVRCAVITTSLYYLRTSDYMQYV
ncbi:MAG: hypothetical protein ACYC2T_05140 [Bacillota bacterium]